MFFSCFTGNIPGTDTGHPPPKNGLLTIHDQHYALADRGRHSVAGYAQIRPHVVSIDPWDDQ